MYYLVMEANYENIETGMAAKVSLMTDGNFNGMYRVVLSDTDAGETIQVRYCPTAAMAEKFATDCMK